MVVAVGIRSLAFYVLGWVALLLPLQANAAPVLLLNSEEGSFKLDRHLDYFEDRCSCKSIEEIASAVTVFAPPVAADLAVRYTSSALWVRFTVHNTSPKPITRWLVVLPAHMERISLFKLLEGQWQKDELGTGLPFSSRKLQTTAPTFAVHLDAGQRTTYWLRVAGQTSKGIDTALWDPAELRSYQERNALWAGISWMLYLTITLAAFIAFAVARQRSLLYLAIAASAGGLYIACMHGYGVRYLWPDFPGKDVAATLFGGIAAIMFQMFVREEFQLRQRSPRLELLIRTLLVIELTLIPFSLVGPTRMEGNYAMSLGAFALSIVGAIAVASILPDLWKKRLTPEILIACFVTLRPIGTMIRSFGNGFAGVRPPKPAGPGPELLAVTSIFGLLMILTFISWMRRERRRDEMLSHIAHDLRAPVATVLSAVRRVRDEAEVTEADKSLTDIERSASQQLELIGDLVDLGHAETDVRKSAAVPFHLPGFIRDLADQAESLARQNGNEFELRIPVELPSAVRADPRRVRQVVMNLISNAAKFTDGGSITLTVSADLAPGTSNCTLRFDVLDTGPGIDEEDQQQIFEPFKRGRNSDATLGSGLGLAIVKRWIDALGGSISLESRVGAGSRFTVALPVALALNSDADDRAIPRIAG